MAKRHSYEYHTSNLRRIQMKKNMIRAFSVSILVLIIIVDGFAAFMQISYMKLSNDDFEAMTHFATEFHEEYEAFLNNNIYDIEAEFDNLKITSPKYPNYYINIKEDGKLEVHFKDGNVFSDYISYVPQGHGALSYRADNRNILSILIFILSIVSIFACIYAIQLCKYIK